MKTRILGCLLLAGLLLTIASRAQTLPVLIQEVISREVSVSVTSGPSDTQEVVSREVSFFVGAPFPDPQAELISREVSFLVSVPFLPAAVSPLSVTTDGASQTASLSWQGYNEPAQLDVAGYNVYVSASPITNVTGLTPYTHVPAGKFSVQLTGLGAFQDHYFAIVPVDVTGVFNPTVTFAATYALSREVVSRETSFFIGGDPATPVRELVSREVGYLVAVPFAPAAVSTLSVTTDGASQTASLSWLGYNEPTQLDVAGYDVYVSSNSITNVTGLSPYTHVSAGTFGVQLTGLSAFRDHFFAVVPVDVTGAFSPSVTFGATYALTREVVSRETSFFNGGDPVTPVGELVSREASYLVASGAVPDPVTGLSSGFSAITSTKAYAALDLRWPNYDEVAQNDVVRYRIYLGSSFFTDVSSAKPYAYIPAQRNSWTLTGLNPFAIDYVAVVAEDVLGQFNPTVRAVSAQASAGSLAEVGNLQVMSRADSLAFSWLPPIDAGTFLLGYKIYFPEADLAVGLPAGATSYLATGLKPARGYSFRIDTVDIFGAESAGTSLLAATLLDSPALTAQGFNSVVNLNWTPAQPSSILNHYAVYLSDTNFSSLAGMAPFLLTSATGATIPGLVNGHTYYCAVTAVNISGGESALGQVVATTPQVVVNPAARLSVLVDPGSTNLKTGDSFSYTITLTNAGYTALSGVQLANALPAGLDLDYVRYGRGTVALDDTSIGWSLASLNTNSATTLTVYVTAVEPGAWTNSFYAFDSLGLTKATEVQVINVKQYPVQLDITATGQSVTLSWPAFVNGLLLQASTTLGPTATWTAVTNHPAVMGDQRAVTLPTSAHEMFFRLLRSQ